MSSHVAMRAYLIYTGTGPILVLTTYSALDDPRLLDKLRYKGIGKFIGYEVPLEIVRERYEHSFANVAVDLQIFLHDAASGLSLRAAGRQAEADERLRAADDTTLRGELQLRIG